MAAAGLACGGQGLRVRDGDHVRQEDVAPRVDASQRGPHAALPAALRGPRPASVATPRVQALVISIPGSAIDTTCLTMNQSTNVIGG